MWDSVTLTRSLSGTQSGHLTLTEINLMDHQLSTVFVFNFSSHIDDDACKEIP